MELYLILLFISIGTVRHNIEVSHCTSKSFLFKSTPLYFYVALTEDGVWMTWSLWGDCTVTCGGGLQYRNRSCDGPRYGGAECAGAGEEKRDCGENPCPSKTTAQQIWVNLVYFYSKASSKIVHVLLNRGKIINLIYSFILYRCYIFKKVSFVCELCPFCVLPLPTSCHPFISAFPSRHVINSIFYPPQYTTLRLFFSISICQLCKLFPEESELYYLYIFNSSRRLDVMVRLVKMQRHLWNRYKMADPRL